MSKLGSRKLHISPKVTKMGSIIGHRIDYKRWRGSEKPAAHTQQKFTQVSPPREPFASSSMEFQYTGGSIFYSYSSNSGFHLLRFILLLLLCFWAAVGLFLPRIMCKIYHHFKAPALPKTKMSLFLSRIRTIDVNWSDISRHHPKFVTACWFWRVSRGIYANQKLRNILN